jgi:hypothetical protein
LSYPPSFTLLYRKRGAAAGRDEHEDGNRERGDHRREDQACRTQPLRVGEQADAEKPNRSRSSAYSGVGSVVPSIVTAKA